MFSVDGGGVQCECVGGCYDKEKEGMGAREKKENFSSSSIKALSPIRLVLEKIKVTLVGLLLLDDLALVTTNGIGPLVETNSQGNGTDQGQSLLNIDGDGQELSNLGRGDLVTLGTSMDTADHQDILGDAEHGEGNGEVRDEVKFLVGEGKGEGGDLEDGHGDEADDINGEVGGVEVDGGLGRLVEGLGVRLGVGIDGDQVNVGEPAVEGNSDSVDSQDGEDKVLVDE